MLMLDVAYALARRRRTVCGCLALCGDSGARVIRPLSVAGKALTFKYWRQTLHSALTAFADRHPDDLKSLEGIRAAVSPDVHMDDFMLYLSEAGLLYYGEKKGETLPSDNGKREQQGSIVVLQQPGVAKSATRDGTSRFDVACFCRSSAGQRNAEDRWVFDQFLHYTES